MGTLQARILEWVAMPSSRGSSQPRFPTLQVDSLLSETPGKPKNTGVNCLYLLQGIFPTQESNRGVLHGRWILYQLSYQKPHDKPRQPIKVQRHHLKKPNHRDTTYCQSCVFSSSHVWMWELDHKKAEHQRADAFKLWLWKRLLRARWNARRSNQSIFFFSFLFIYLFLISWRLITLQYCSGFCHTLTWISLGYICIPHPDPPSHLPLHPIPLGLPSAQGPSTCLMYPTWVGDLFHYR